MDTKRIYKRLSNHQKWLVRQMMNGSTLILVGEEAEYARLVEPFSRDWCDIKMRTVEILEMWGIVKRSGRDCVLAKGFIAE
jgi:hypothetical protein